MEYQSRHKTRHRQVSKNSTGKVSRRIGGSFKAAGNSARVVKIADLEEKDKEIRQHQEYLKIITENMTDALIIINPDGSYAYLNKHAYKLAFQSEDFKYHSESLAHTEYYDEAGKLLTKEDMPGSRVLRGETLDNVIIKAVRPDKTIFMSFNGKPVYLNGVLTHAIVCIRDITERNEYRSIIVQHKEHLETVIENITDAVFVFDSNENVISCNPPAQELNAALSNNELKIEDRYKAALPYDIYGNVIPLDEVPAKRVIIGERFAGMRVSHKLQGKTIELEVSGAPIYDADGKFTMGVLCCHDITELIKSELEIKRQKEQLEAVIENMHDAFAIYNKEGELIQLNAEARKMYPHLITNKKVVDAHSVFQYFNLENNPIALDSLPTRRAFRGENIRNEKIIIKKPDKTQYTEINATPIYDIDNNLDAVVITHRDITEIVKQQQDIKNHQELLLKKEIENNMILKDKLEKMKTIAKLEELIAYKNKLASAITHDIRAPLSMIISLTELMEYEGNVGDNSGNIVTEVRKQIINTYFMVENMLEWFGHQMKDQNLNGQNLKLLDIVNSTLDIIRLNAKLKDVHISAAISEEKIVYADKGILEFILRNILTNAIKFSYAGGAVSIRAESDNDKVIVAVSDTGIGINTDRIKSIFENNSPISTIGTEGERGMGLGLTFCKEFIQRCGGDIWVESVEGEGSTFYFSLPNPVGNPFLSEEKQQEARVGIVENEMDS